MASTVSSDAQAAGSSMRTARSDRRIHLVGHICTGPTNHHNGSWRHPQSDADTLLQPERYERLARLYESGVFDAVFIVDYQVIIDLVEGSTSKNVERGGQLAMLDPIQVLGMMARVTDHLGLAATMSTSFHHPYHIARVFSTLDHLSHGRAGWNIVTSAFDQEARNFGQERLLDKSLRYDHADQVVEACQELWHSWDADALKVDRDSGRFADPDAVHFIRYENSMVRTAGALTTPRSPQDSPVLMQAGASERGRDFAARWAEVIFTQQGEKARMQAFYADMERRMIANGRSPDDCAVLPSIDVVVGETDAIAREKAAYVDSFANIEASLRYISEITRTDLSGYPLDTPLSMIKMSASTPASAGAVDNMMAMGRAGGEAGRELTLGELAQLQATTWWSPRLVGTAETIVDTMQDLFEDRCCDGFIITNSVMPDGLADFVRLVVPELQRRNLYPTRYMGKTFRENLKSGATA